MGRRRRRVVRIVKKKLPTVFVCPKCGEEAVRVTIAKDTGKAVVRCSACQLKDEFQAHPAAQMIDVYSYFTDKFYGVKDPRAIIPREREMTRVVPEPEEEPPELITPEAPSEPSISESQQVAETANAPPVEAQPEPSSVAESPKPLLQPVDESEGKAADVPAEEQEARPEEEPEPFADILQNKDKKRYSPNPLPNQSSE